MIFLMVGLPLIEVEFMVVILVVEVIHIDEEGSWATASDSLDIWKYHFPNISFVIFLLLASIEVGREYATGWKIFANVDPN